MKTLALALVITAGGFFSTQAFAQNNASFKRWEDGQRKKIQALVTTKGKDYVRGTVLKNWEKQVKLYEARIKKLASDGKFGEIATWSEKAKKAQALVRMLRQATGNKIILLGIESGGVSN